MKVLFEDFILRGEEIWFFSKEFNGLMKMNVNSGVVDIVSKIPKYSYNTERLITKIVEYDEKLFCIPMNADELWIYSPNRGGWEAVDIGCDPKQKINGKFFQAYLYENRIYFIPSSYKKILVLDVETYTVKSIDFADERTVELRENVGDCFFRTDSVLIDHYIYLASCIDNRVLIVDIDKDTFGWRTVGKNVYRYSGIAYDGEQFWLAPRKEGNVLVWDGADECREIEIPQRKNANYLGIIYYDGKFCMSGQSACGNITIDRNTGEIFTDSITYLANKVSEEEYMNISIQHNAKVHINTRDKTDMICKCEIDEEKMMDYVDLDSVLAESELLTLNMFINKLHEEKTK